MPECNDRHYNISAQLIVPVVVHLVLNQYTGYIFLPSSSRRFSMKSDIASRSNNVKFIMSLY